MGGERGKRVWQGQPESKWGVGGESFVGGRGGLEANLEHITCTEGRSSRFSAEDGLRQQMQNRDKERPVDFRPCNFAKLCLIFNISPPQFNISPLSGND